MSEKEDVITAQVKIPKKIYEESLFFVKERKYLNYFIEQGFEELVKRRQGAQGRALTQDEQKIEKIVRRVLSEKQ